MNKVAATNSLERGLAILQVIGARPGGAANSEISLELGIPRSTCSYILSRLAQGGYVTKQTRTGRFRIGLKTLSLAHDALREIGLHSVAEATLYRLAETTGLAAVLGALEGDRCLTVDRVESPEFVRDSAETGRSSWSYYPPRELRSVGAENPVHATSYGRVLLAYLPHQELVEMLDRIPLTKPSPYTIVSVPELMAEFEQIREQGYAVADRQFQIDALGVAAPIFGAGGTVRAAVSVGGSRSLPLWDDLGKIIRLVREAAGEISKRISHPLLMQPETLRTKEQAKEVSPIVNGRQPSGNNPPRRSEKGVRLLCPRR